MPTGRCPKQQLRCRKGSCGGPLLLPLPVPPAPTQYPFPPPLPPARNTGTRRYSYPASTLRLPLPMWLPLPPPEKHQHPPQHASIHIPGYFDLALLFDKNFNRSPTPGGLNLYRGFGQNARICPNAGYTYRGFWSYPGVCVKNPCVGPKPYVYIHRFLGLYRCFLENPVYGQKHMYVYIGFWAYTGVFLKTPV